MRSSSGSSDRAAADRPPRAEPRRTRGASDPAYEALLHFFATLREAGVRHVIASPGSRSTPLLVAALHTRGLSVRMQLDERSAAFFALGLARAGDTPVALLCTSGTAAANYHPAVAEAHHARVPLLVLTADRPPELRDWDAGQTIDQQRLYGSHVRWFAELPVAGERGLTPDYAEAVARRAVAIAADRPAGPVHLNWPLREPLEPRTPLAPPGAADARPAAPAPGVAGRGCGVWRRGAGAPPPDVTCELAQWMRDEPRGLVVCGPLDEPADTLEAIAALADAGGWPLVADPLSGLRGVPRLSSAPVLHCADAWARTPLALERCRPRAVLRFGRTPTSKALRLWLEHAPARVIHVDGDAGFSDASHGSDGRWPFDPGLLAHATQRRMRPTPRHSAWRAALCAVDAAAGRAIAQQIAAAPALLAPQVVRTLAGLLPADGLLYVSNSMPIREVDAFWPADAPLRRILGNRGANGIDGVTSSALGAAAAGPGGAVLLTGDLAFLHDVGGLWAASREPLPCVIVVLDDDGGGIFSYLPIAERGDVVDLERWYRLPHGLDLARAAALYDLPFARVRSAGALAGALHDARRAGGTHVLCVPLDRDANVAHHRAIQRGVAEALEGSGVRRAVEALAP